MAGWWRKLWRKLRGKWLERKVRRGKATWGRQPPSAISAPLRGKVQISARVYRAATGKWEDLGRIS